MMVAMSTAIPPWWSGCVRSSASGWGGSIWPRPAQGGTAWPIRGPSGVADAPLRLRQRRSGRLRQPPAGPAPICGGRGAGRGRRLRRHLSPHPPAGRSGKHLCGERRRLRVLRPGNRRGAVQRLRQPGRAGRHPPVHLRRGRASPRQCGGRRPHLLAQSPGRSLRPGGGGAFGAPRRAARAPLCAAGRGVFGSGGGPPVEYCTLEQAVRLERLLTRLDQSAQ